MKVLCLFLLLAAGSRAYDMPSQDEIWTAIDLAQEVFEGDSEMIGMAIRLSFHDCVGGCNGQINPDDHENAGLTVIVDLLEDKWSGISDVMSRADFWALAGYAGVDKGITGSNRDCPRVNRVRTYCLVPAFNMTFEWGREDADSSTPYGGGIDGIPSAGLTTDEVYDFFDTEFGMSVQDTVAVMGAHNIGGTHEEYSGFLGNWLTCSIRQWNNLYFDIMTEPIDIIDWLQRNRATDEEPYYQFMGFNTTTESRQAIMLPTDWAMMYQNEVDSDTFLMACDPQFGEATCEKSVGYDYVIEYAHDYDSWMADFRTAFEIMISNGCTNCAEALEILPLEQK